ncbi:4-coumarate--CoA ligase 1 [Manduca sexta]|uniref:Uncharacterized protein n=1 Tax=Manduca sexta TaxID=7130 RepID=A0A921ZLI4_MANSE|nr:4-coumarate--CoA ligase 1 [Manduca sexta]XP_030033614.1 4-coumarate--CoA ligase 1 [Manduca sexta]XP_030033616.1 4-coumarate--CoA ligase 1 [Manduca sexta]XP_037293280.1 4-coumarate--CoA ligase 1 [Manduca sexta]KAG6459991.1 hypothetical protein O3G_MSEX011711 [Manduca sexta]KAG6459992.1 hypothetical protein O3G_MSEX011711 [Manduca sexta]KAG6459993.1 hypothetical protein O3G_MSEX011711 [Manduca sexta]KAG6459994.1 hypothetical protein O3G_MSEX011711 [Manduca sexta]
MVSKNLFVAKRTLNRLCQSSKYVCVVRKNSVWTQDNIIKSPFKSVEIPNCTLYDYVWQNLDRWPERTLAVCATTGRGYTYEQGFKLSNTFAANLRKKFKIRDGDVVAVMLPNIPDFPLVTMGIMEAGGTVTTINPIYTAHEVQRQLLLSEAKLVITLPETVKIIREALAIAKLNVPIIVVNTNGESIPEGTVLFNELSEDLHVDKSCLKEVRRGPNDICFLPYSSGTTGLPKGVELSMRNLIVNCEQVNDPLIRCHSETTATHQDRALVVLPLFHIFAATVLMFHKMSLGIKLVTLTKFQPDTFFEAMEKYKTNLLFVAPPLMLLMGSHPASTERSLQYLEVLVNGAAPLASSDVDRLFERAKRKIDFRQGYGLTETSPTVTLTPVGYTKNFSGTGPPIPNTDLRIVDSNFNNLGPNETGEILIRGPQVMRGYRNNPQATSEVFTSDGWFRSGDLGIVDEDGILVVADRLKELIKVKGFQVPPAELEAVLREHPSVEDAAVIGVPHSVNGESPKAFAVLKKGCQSPAEELCAFVNERVAPYKRIQHIVFLDSIPKSQSGKILRRVLKEQYS